MTYPFSQLIREIFKKLQGASAPVYKHTPSAIDAAGSKNFLTQGGANLASFFVASPTSMVYTGVVAPRNITQIRSLQLRKEGK